MHASKPTKSAHRAPLKTKVKKEPLKQKKTRKLSTKRTLSIPPASITTPPALSFPLTPPRPLSNLSRRLKPFQLFKRGAYSQSQATLSKRPFSSTPPPTPLQPQPQTPPQTFSSMISTPQVQMFDHLLGGDFTLHSLLDKNQRELLRSIKQLLSNIEEGLTPLGLTESDAQLLRDASNQLDELFILVAMGEYNSGKSSLLNSLMGGKFCATGALPTTDAVNIYRYGDKNTVKTLPQKFKNKIIVNPVPVEWLRLVHIVDTPGTNAIIEEHQAISEHYIPNSDLVLFVTSVERPFSQSERQFLRKIHQWGKKVVFVVNKVDSVLPDLEQTGIDQVNSQALAQANQPLDQLPKRDYLGAVDKDGKPRMAGENPEEDLANIINFVQYHTAKELGDTIPPTFAVSSKLGLKAKEQVESIKKQQSDGKLNQITASAQMLQAQAVINNSGLSSLENYILTQLTGTNKIKIKLSNPLAISRKIITTYTSALNDHKSRLDFELAALSSLNVYIQQYLTYIVPTSTKHLDPLQKIFADIQADTVAYIKTQYTVSSTLSMLGGKLGSHYIQDVLGKTDDIITKHSAQAFTQLQTGTSQLAVLLGQNLTQSQRSGKETSKLPVSKQFISKLAKQQDINGTDDLHEQSPDEDEGENGENNALNAEAMNHGVPEDEAGVVNMTSSEAMFLVGPHLTKLLSTLQQQHLAKSVHPMLESTLYDQIPTTISQRGKRAVNTALTLATTGFGVIGSSIALFPEPTIMLTGIAILLSGLVWFPIQRSALRRDITKQLDQLHHNVVKKVEQELNHDSNECVIRINAMISQLQSSLLQEHTVISTTLTQLNNLHRDIHSFEGTIHNIDEKQQLPSTSV